MKNKKDTQFMESMRNSNKLYKNFIKFAIKKGKKEKIENLFRKSLFHVAKQNKTEFWNITDKAIKNTSISLNVKVKRQGSKNIYIPIKLKDGYSIFLSYSWILKSARKRHEKKFINKLINEIIETAENKNATSKRRVEIYKLVEENINNTFKRR